MSNLVWVGLVLLIIARIFIFQPVEVNGNSMVDNLHQGNRLIVEEVSNKLGSNFERGQIIVYCADTKDCDKDNALTRINRIFYIKRIIGKSGESIEIKNDKTIIYNQEHPEGAVINEDYLSPSVKKGLQQTNKFDLPKTLIPEGYYFIMGDNRVDSSDSRSFGPVPAKALLGKAWLQFWPINDADILSLPEYKFTSIQ